MATHTDYFNLKKPESYENYNVEVFNDNAGTIDLQMHNNQVSAAKVMVGATSIADGESGRVPTPHAGDEDKFLKGDGTWAEAGSSNVEANPSGTPTETLESIGIDNVIYQLPEGGDTEITGDAEGSVISIDDGKLNEPLKACTVDINPVQSGSGTPSPSNIRPISGWTEANVTRCGVNVWGGEKLADDIVAKVPNATKDTTNKTVTYSAAYVNGIVLFDNFIPNTIYTIFMMKSSTEPNVMVRYTDGTTEVIHNLITVTQANKSIECIVGMWVTGNTVLKYEECGVFEGVITAEDFEPYNGTTYSIEFEDSGSPLTVYGGTLDTVSGVLTVTDGYIASYDGETLPSTWISDRDVYASGTTPTTGAEVVYKLATPTEVSLTPAQIITTLYGKNVIWADSGDIAITYVRDTSIAINDALNQSITPTYSSGTKIADYNVGGKTGAIYVQGAGGHKDVLWTGNETPTMSYNPTITLSHPISDYDFLLVNFNIDNEGTHLKTTLTLYGATVGDNFAQEFLAIAGAIMFVNILNDYNITLGCYGGNFENTTYVSIIGVKL